MVNHFSMKLWKICLGLVAIGCTGIRVSYAQQHAQDSLLRLIEHESNDTLRIKYFRDLGFLHTKRSSEMAKTYFRQAIALGNKIHEHLYTTSSYVQLGILYSNLGQSDSAAYFLREAKKQAEIEKSNADLWMGYYQGEGIYHKHKGEYKLALVSYMKGVEWSKGPGQEISQAGFFINIGNVYKETGALQDAILYELKALKLFEQLDNIRGMAYCYQNIGDIFIKLEQYEDAFRYLQMAAPLKAKLGDKKALGSLLEGMGLTTFGMGEYTKALSYAEQAVSTYRDLQLKQKMTGGYLLISKIYRATGKSNLADKYLSLASNESDSLGNEALSESIAAEKLNVGAPSQLPVDTMATLNHIQTIINKSNNSGDSNRIATGYQTLSVYYARHNNFEKAYENLKKYYTLQNSMTGGEVQLQIKELETRYQVEKKEKQILLLQKDKAVAAARMQEQRFLLIGALSLALLVAVISFLLISRSRIIQRSKRLLEMEKIRNHIARDLHDDIGSTLSSIQLMGSVALKNKADGKYVKEYLEKIVDNSKRMSVSMQDIVWAINPVNDGLDKMILRMKEYAAERLEPLDIIYQFTLGEKTEDVKLPLHQRKDLFMMYKEIINNAVKYSDCNLMQIYFALHEHHLKLSVDDNGKGFDMEKYCSGNGLNNMRVRAKQMNALINIHSEIDKGTTISLSIPLP